MTISASEVRQIVREELAAALHPSVQRSPRVADGMGGFKTVTGHDPAGDSATEVTVTFTPLNGGPTRQFKTLPLPQDGGQRLEP